MRLKKSEQNLIKSRLSKYDGKEGFFTYGDLLADLKKMSKKELSQEVMILPPAACYDKPVRLEPAAGFGTCKTMGVKTRSTVDDKHHAGQYVIIRDECGFDEDGNSFFEMIDVEGETKLRGNKTGKLYDF